MAKRDEDESLKYHKSYIAKQKAKKKVDRRVSDRQTMVDVLHKAAKTDSKRLSEAQKGSKSLSETYSRYDKLKADSYMRKGKKPK